MEEGFIKAAQNRQEDNQQKNLEMETEDESSIIFYAYADGTTGKYIHAIDDHRASFLPNLYKQELRFDQHAHSTNSLGNHGDRKQK